MLNIFPLMSDHPAAKKNEMLDIPARKKGMGDMPDPAKDHVDNHSPSRPNRFCPGMHGLASGQAFDAAA